MFVAISLNASTQTLDGCSILCNEKTGEIFQLEGVASDFLGLVDGITGIEDIAKELSLTYEVTSDRILGDILALVDELRRGDFVVTSEVPFEGVMASGF